ncbi:transcriptional regulator with XRE-family HTH domain/tetratricopeptide (TPR) repeat protein [Catenuloplanes nepalensis]|uniref:Transcriptional regulator with XRE-family HTH domain/tetratricopeptide (TPR) repeat protein n=1 Tax=Catenuloplanes nepalensis TaxID=587533 RepID=A0ABT9MT67_9ACTN|nr:helix-turn-helix domain-containing protein [Catenuloplanes nepalensis]MDP9794578.1 transcriptional regulator with XRE-family HTH domain/tetratricopeptide (TPR) repeat protein [Catenuloplanes nepalensis]
MTSFGDRLRQVRRDAGLTLEQLAEASGVSDRTISDMERGHSRAPQARTLTALADGLGLTGDARAVLIAAAKEARSASAAGRPRVGDLPRGVTDFVGRAAELAIARDAAQRAGHDAGPPPVLVVHGTAGLGKTAFAVRVADDLRDDFPDGRVYLDLRGTDPEPVAAGEALQRLLRALDVPAARIAAADDDRSAQLRALLEDRRCLLVLDNAGSEAQVRPLLPATGPCLVVVTSRRMLGGLEGVLRIPLPPLTPSESAGLLGAIASQAADPEAAAQVETVSRLCGHLPLALRIAGTRLASRPQWTVAGLAGRLAGADRRLAVLSAGDARVAAAFGLSYAQLSGPAATLFRRLAHVPGADFAAPLAAVLTEAPLPDAEDHLDELVEIGLLQPQGVDRYRFHDLIRLYAEERLRAEETAEDRAAAVRRMTDWLLDTARVAGLWYHSGDGEPPDGWDGLAPLATLQEAGAWLRAETDNWRVALRLAAAGERHQLVVDVVFALGYYADSAAHWPGWVETHGLAMRAAKALPDRKQRTEQLTNYAWALLYSGGRAEEAAEVAMEAYRLGEETGDLEDQRLAIGYAGAAWRHLGRLDDALRAFGQAVDLARRTGDDGTGVRALVAYALTLQTAGRYREAVGTYREVLAGLDRFEAPPIEVRTTRMGALAGLTTAHCALEQWSECLGAGGLVLPLATELGNARQLGRVLIATGRAHAALGDAARARADLIRGMETLEGNFIAGSTLDLDYLARAAETLRGLASS